MIIQKFVANKVHGYLNFDIDFYKDVTFLIGINGTGKTTVLRLISAMLTPSFIELYNIDFDDAYVKCSDNDGKVPNIEIWITKNNKSISIKKVQGEDTASQTMSYPELQKESTGFSGTNRFFDFLCEEFNKLKIVRDIRTLRSPTFLNIKRCIKNGNDEIQVGDSLPILRKNSDETRAGVDSALSEIQSRFYSLTRLNASRQAVFANNFRTAILKESISYVDVSIEGNPFKVDAHVFEDLENRKTKLNKLLGLLNDNELTDKCSLVLTKLQNSLTTLTNKDVDEKEKTRELFNWVVNSTLLEKFDRFIGIGEEYLQKIVRLNESKQRFVDSINMFFNESAKTLHINDKGEIKITVANTKRVFSMFDLSSGEKQLLVLFADLALDNKSAHSTFFIDEPEISLHISWQENVVAALRKVSPNTQLILATHSPSVLSRQEWREKCVDLTPTKL